MINKRAVLVRLALTLALVPVSAIAGEGSGAIAVQEPDLFATVRVGGVQIYECVEDSGKLVCKFRELSATPSAEAMVSGWHPAGPYPDGRRASDAMSGHAPVYRL